MAGSDLPDIIAVLIFSTTMPNMADFLNSACADLTPYLGGDAIKAYPNLANFPSTAWPSTVFNNKIMALPVAAGGVRTSPLLLARGGDLEAAGFTSITSPDEFMGASKQLNNPGTRWALGANTLVRLRKNTSRLPSPTRRWACIRPRIARRAQRYARRLPTA